MCNSSFCNILRVLSGALLVFVCAAGNVDKVAEVVLSLLKDKADRLPDCLAMATA